MARHTIFTNSILVDNLDNSNLKDEILKELKIHEDLKKGRQFSNFGGFQTLDIKNKFICKTVGQKCVEMLFESYDFKIDKIIMCNLWINKNNKNDFNLPHVHPSCQFSGAYYLETPQKGGELSFMRNECSVFSELESFIPNNLDFNEKFYIKPKNNLFIVFPAYLKHMVMPHKEDKTRISVSFNIKLKNG